MERLVYDGSVLSDLCTVVGVIRPLPTMRASVESLPDADRIAHKGSGIEPPAIQFTLIVDGKTDEERRGIARRLAPILLKKDPVRVEFGSDGGLYYIAIIDDEMELTELVRTGTLTVRMKALQAAMYGAEQSVAVPSGNEVEFTVYGSYPTAPTISAEATRDASTGLWGIRLDDGDFIRIATGTSSSASVHIDCEKRTAKVAGATAMITPDSDWLMLDPGVHTIRNDLGSGSAVISWKERWL